MPLPSRLPGLLLILFMTTTAYLDEKEVHVPKALQQKAATNDACEASWRVRQLRTPGGQWASGARSAKPGSNNISSYEASGVVSTRLKFAAVATLHEVPAALRLTRLLKASGYEACDFHFVCVDDGCQKELMGQGLPAVLATDSSRSYRHACDNIARDARREAGKQAGVDKKTVLTVHLPSASETRKCVIASERMAMVANLLRSQHAVVAVDLSGVFFYQDPLLYVNPLPQALVAARDFSFFVVRPHQGLTAQLFDRMLKEYHQGYHEADQHLFHRNVKAFLARDQLHVLDPTRYVRATEHARHSDSRDGNGDNTNRQKKAFNNQRYGARHSSKIKGSNGADNGEVSPPPPLMGTWNEAAQPPGFRYINGSIVENDESPEAKALAAEMAAAAATPKTKRAVSNATSQGEHPHLLTRTERRRTRMVALHVTCVEGVVAREWAARSLFGWTDDSFGAYTHQRRLTLTLHDQSSVDLPTLKLVSAALAAVAQATRRSVRAFPPLRPSGLQSEPFWNVLSADRLAQWADVELVEHDYYERVAKFFAAKRMYQATAASTEEQTRPSSHFRPFTREVIVPIGLGNDFIDRCVAAVRKQEWRMAYPGDGFSGDLGRRPEDSSGHGDEAFDLDGTPISRARKRPGKRVRVDEIILVPDFSGDADKTPKGGTGAKAGMAASARRWRLAEETGVQDFTCFHLAWPPHNHPAAPKVKKQIARTCFNKCDGPSVPEPPVSMK